MTEEEQEKNYIAYLNYMYMHIVILISYSIPALFVLIKTRMVLDKSAIINITFFWSCYTVKLIGALLNVIKAGPIVNYMTIVEFISDQFVILSMYIFVFEMLVVYYKVTCKDMREYQISKESCEKLKIGFFIW